MAGRRPKKRADLVAAFAARLREVRRDAGLTQAALAAAAGVSATYVSELENAEAAPGLDVLGRLADALGVPPSALFRTPEPQPLDEIRERVRLLAGRLVDEGDGDALARLVPLLELFMRDLARRL